ncbi:MAG TPA: cysteine desulfurase [Acetobacteraceae bacterium]|nr:cysteine desulfurase [Acetobacteraceae bacterium]
MNVITRPAAPAAGFAIDRIRADFPILAQQIRGRPLVFLDSAASAQKPRVVIDAMRNAMETQYANVHRGLHWMSERTTDAYESARDAVAALMNARDRHEVVFTRNVTESLNLMAHSYGRGVMRPGQAVVISAMEHHSNIIPWQLLRDERGIELRVAPITDSGELDLDAFERLLSDGKVGLVSMTHMSNVLGTVTPAEQIVRIAHAHGAKVLFDGAQAVVHRQVDVQALDCDFYAWTGHKLYGPTGIGVLWGRRELLDRMPPFLGGGEMIASVSYAKSTWAELPHKFEAGTPPILEGIGLKAAIDYVRAIGYDAIAAREHALVDHALARLDVVPGLTILGRAQDRGGVVAFALDKAHAHDVATLLDRQGIAVRAGHHCAEPLMHRFGLESTARASFGLYTTHEEIDALADGLVRVREFFA